MRNKLVAVLGGIYRVLDKRRPPSPHRLLTTFLGIYEDVLLKQATGVEVNSPPHPGYWADNEGSWSDTVNLLWDEGQYAIPVTGGHWDDGISKWNDGVTTWS